MGIPTPDMLYRLKYTSNPTSVAYTGTAGRTAALDPGLYEIVSSTDCFVLQGGSGVTATSSSNPLSAWAPRLLYVEATAVDGYVSAIQSSSGGTLYAIKRNG